jgi:hypothetical protein
MDFLEDWYSPQNEYYDEIDEKERERLSAWPDAAPGDIPTGGLQNTREPYSSFSHDSADFINRMNWTDLIQHLLNGDVADIDFGPGEQVDLPTRDQSVYDFLRKPAEPLDDLGFFDRNVPAKLFRDMAGSTGPDKDFWERLRKESNDARPKEGIPNDEERGQGASDSEAGGPIEPQARYDPGGIDGIAPGGGGGGIGWPRGVTAPLNQPSPNLPSSFPQPPVPYRPGQGLWNTVLEGLRQMVNSSLKPDIPPVDLKQPYWPVDPKQAYWPVDPKQPYWPVD